MKRAILAVCILGTGMILGCQPQGIDNPGANAQTYSEDEFRQDYLEATDKECSDQDKNIRNKKTEALRRFVDKYNDRFRIRYKNGDLKLRSLSDESLESISKELEDCLETAEDSGN